MKKFFTLLKWVLFIVLITIGTANAQWLFNGNHIYNTNTQNVGIGTGGLWTPTEKLHINNGNNTARVLVEMSYAGSTGMQAISSLRLQNSATGDLYQAILRKNNASHQMVQSCYDASAGAWREFNFFDFATRKYEMRSGILDAEFLNAGRFLINSTGNTGIGIANPLERLDVNGAIRLGNTVNSNTGTMRWNGSNFEGYNGAGWVQLDVQQAPPTWLALPNPAPGFGNPQLYPAMPPGSVSTALPGMPNMGGWIHGVDAAAPGLYPHQLLLETMTGGGPIMNASQLYRISNGFNPPYIDFSAGIFGLDGTYKICNGAVLTATTHADNSTLIRARSNGIVDLPNQSRVRAIVPFIDWAQWQLIQPNTWTPVNYTNPTPGIPLMGGMPFWDEQGEFTAAVAPNQVIINNQPNSFFTAATDGFYQVNARCEFETDEYWDAGMVFPVFMRANAFVSIAIYYDWQGQWNPYAVGNNLQTTNNLLVQAPPPEFPQATQTLTNNNAPNVSDVVWLQAGDRISIWVFHWAFTPMMLRVGETVLYVSIHKVS